MNRFSLSLLLSLGVMSLCLQAQTSSTITISTSPAGARFAVDGQVYISAATLNWPTGSKHIVEFITDPSAPPGNLIQTSLDGSTVYLFTSWVYNGGSIQTGNDPLLTVTADPSVTSLTANLTVSYRLYLNFPNTNSTVTPPTCGSPGAIPAGQFSPGVVDVNGTCYWSSVTLYLPANTTVPLNAFPYPGFAFTGWTANQGLSNPFLSTLVLNGATTLSPVFVPAKRVHFLTSPLGLNVLVDHTSVPTRNVAGNLDGPCPNGESQPIIQTLGFPTLCIGDFDFAPGSTHVISGVSPQMDYVGSYWVFTGWSNGLGANAVYTTNSDTNTPDVLTANFVAGEQVSLITSPTGLPLTVDGRQNWPAYNFVWGLGSTHQISAAATVSASNGRQYTFQGWSNGGAASQTLNITQSMSLVATYKVLSRVVIQSSPTGVPVQVDGTNCPTPCTIDRPSGSQVHLTAQTQIPMGAGSRLDFNSWSDGSAADHVMTINQDYTALTVAYTNSYQLSAGSAPANGASFQFSPASSDLFFPLNTQVAVTVTPNPGFKFVSWSGALSGTYPSGVITMAAPQTVIAQMNSVPYIAPAGVLNAVGPTPAAAVAPGSIISIFGQGLAPGVQPGPANPLKQTLAGVTVTVNDSILPLLFVSPQQVNAQVPFELPEGNYTLVVHNTGQPDVSATFTLARNAPGLFSQYVNSQQYAVALHADGSAINPGSPATAGETISILGTGFGPFASSIPDGFFPPVPAPALADTVTLTVGGLNPIPSWSGAASGSTGLASTTFTVPDALAGGGAVPFMVTVNGVNSNTVMLPVQ